MDAGNGTNRAVAEINVTPMIDILLVLLIIFLMIQPAAPNGLNSRIPQPPRPGEPASGAVVVEVQRQSTGATVYRINQKPFERQEVLGELRKAFAQRADRTMFLKGDAALSYRDIAGVVDLGHQAGVDNVALLTPGVDPVR